MVNYRRFVCEVAVVAVLVAVASTAPAPDCTEPHAHYDQRQNGTENYRLNIDGVVIAVAPAETLMSALTDMDDLLDLVLSLEEGGNFNEDYPAKPPSATPASQLSVSSTPAAANKPEGAKPPSDKPDETKPEDAKPVEAKPVEAKPEEAKPDTSPLSDVSLSDDLKGQKKDASHRKQEKAQRLKNRLASFLVPLLRKTRHH